MESSEAGMDRDVIDQDMVAFFDLLARFDFEDKQKEPSDSNGVSLPAS